MSHKQSQYNQAIDHLAYLVLHYPKTVEELLAKYQVFFQEQPSKAQLVHEVVELLKEDDVNFSKALDEAVQRLLNQENDPFWGAIAKGAVGALGGLFKKKKRRRSGGSANAAAAQAAAVKRDMEMRMQRMREEQERRQREAEQRRREEEARRREAEKKKAEAAQRKTQILLMVGGGILVLGIGAVVVLKSSRSAAPYLPQTPIPR